MDLRAAWGIRIIDDQREGLSAGRRLVPGEGRGNIFADAGIFGRDGLSIGECVARQGQGHGRLRSCCFGFRGWG